MRVVVTMFMTLDGVMEGPGPDDPFELAGWSMSYGNQEIGKFKFDELMASDALLLGRVTYQGFAAAWPSRTDEAGFADRMNSLPKYVISRTLEKAKWNNSTILKGNIAEETAKLKKQPGQDILVAGSATLLPTLMEHDLVDEYRLLTYPVVLGKGKHLFSDRSHVSLELLELKPFSSGAILLRYRPNKNTRT